MNRKRQWIGIACLVLSVAALIAWEQWGRSYFLKSDVLLASQTIPEGTVLVPAMFETGSIEDSAIVDGAYRTADLGKLNGKVAKTTISKNSQITDSLLRDADYLFADNESVYVLRSEWIALRSSSLRSGDIVDLYALTSDTGNYEKIGTYPVAFVKDQNETEVVSTASGSKEGILSRSDSSAEIFNVEIVTTYEEYSKILQKVREKSENALRASATSKSDCDAALLLVQKGELS